jgi:hypothetical protein
MTTNIDQTANETDGDIVISMLKEIFGEDLLDVMVDPHLVGDVYDDMAPCPKELATDEDVAGMVRHMEALSKTFGPAVYEWEECPKPPPVDSEND